MSGLGVPVKLLHESLGHIITVELKTGQLYRGKLAEGTYTKPSNSRVPNDTD
jgi:small nuclear ribonucleoprotein D3